MNNYYNPLNPFGQYQYLYNPAAPVPNPGGLLSSPTLKKIGGFSRGLGGLLQQAGEDQNQYAPAAKAPEAPAHRSGRSGVLDSLLKLSVFPGMNTKGADLFLRGF